MYFRKIVKKKGKDMEKEQVQLVYLTPAAVSSSAASEWLLLKPVIGIVVIAAVVLITMAVKAMRKNRDYWRSRGVPGPPAASFLTGHLRWLISNENPAIFKLRAWTREYGPVYGVMQGQLRVLVVSDPAMLHEVFVSKFEHFHGRKLAPIVGDVDREPRVHMFNARGPRWKRLRVLSNPVFSVANLKKILPVMNDSANHMVRFLDERASAGEAFNIHPHFHEFTMDVISRIALGQQGSRQFANDRVALVKKLFERFGTSPWLYWSHAVPWRLAQLLRGVVRLKGAIFRNDPFIELVRSLDAEVQRRRAQRTEKESVTVNAANEENGLKSGPKKQVDFIDLFLDAESDVLDHQQANSGQKTFELRESKTAKKLTPIEVVAQCFVFLLAGFDTTANALALTCHYLALNPEQQRFLHEEIDEVFGDDDGKSSDDEDGPNYERLAKLRYADAVMKETLRLVPIAAFAASRQCAKSVMVGGHLIEAGTYVQADVLSVHRNPELWGNDAEQFRPERWLDESRSAAIGKIAWMPFGAGPRVCIGQRLAVLEEKLALVHILRRYEILPTETPEELRLVGGTVLNPVSVNIRLVTRGP